MHPKGVFWQPGGVQEFVVKAFLMEVDQMRRPAEGNQRPTWVTPEEAKRRLAKGREVKYSHELETVIDRALERIQFHHEFWGSPNGAARREAGGAVRRCDGQRRVAVAVPWIVKEATKY